MFGSCSYSILTPSVVFGGLSPHPRFFAPCHVNRRVDRLQHFLMCAAVLSNHLEQRVSVVSPPSKHEINEPIRINWQVRITFYELFDGHGAHLVLISLLIMTAASVIKPAAAFSTISTSISFSFTSACRKCTSTSLPLSARSRFC